MFVLLPPDEIVELVLVVDGLRLFAQLTPRPPSLVSNHAINASGKGRLRSALGPDRVLLFRSTQLMPVRPPSDVPLKSGKVPTSGDSDAG